MMGRLVIREIVKVLSSEVIQSRSFFFPHTFAFILVGLYKERKLERWQNALRYLLVVNLNYGTLELLKFEGFFMVFRIEGFCELLVTFEGF